MSVDAPKVPVKLTIKDYKSDLHNDWCPGCLDPDTQIVTRGGMKRIADIEVGDVVLSHDREYHRVTETFSHQHPGAMQRLTVQNFGSVVVTDDHPVYVARRRRRHGSNDSYQPEWVPAGKVARGDYVAFPVPMETVDQPTLTVTFERKKKDTRSKPLPATIPLDTEFLRLAGYYIAEGHTHHREIGFTFGSGEMHLAQDTVALVGKVAELGATIKERPDRGSIEVHVSSAHLATTFGELFGAGAQAKHVPTELMLLPPVKQRALIGGLWAGDGTWGKRNASYRTISPILAEQMKVLLLRQGIVPNVRVEEPHGIHRRAYTVTVSKCDDYNALAAFAGGHARTLSRSGGPARIHDGYVFVPVRRNEVIEYDGMVHNFEVEGAHSYVTSIGALHNCGDFGILTGIQMAFANLGLDPDKVAVFSGIGCAGKTPHYIKTYGFHTLHGRVLPVATGGRLVNSDVTVIALGGDGDGYGIGAGYFVNSGRRNLDFTYLVHNNNVYGLTKGQASPTLSKGKKTKSMPEASIQDGINPIAMAVAAGYTFIARAYALEPKYLAGIIARAIQHKGSAIVDVLQTCPTYNDLYTKEWYEGQDLPEKKSRLYKLEEQGFDGKVQDPSDTKEIIAKKAAAVARSYEAEPIPIGVYYEIELPTYEDSVNQRIPILGEKPLVDVDVFNRDVTPLLEAMR